MSQMLVSISSGGQAPSASFRAAASDRNSWMSRLAQSGSPESPQPMKASSAACASVPPGPEASWPYRPSIANSARSEEHTSELQSLMRISYAVFCLKKKNTNNHQTAHNNNNQT